MNTIINPFSYYNEQFIMLLSYKVRKRVKYFNVCHWHAVRNVTEYLANSKMLVMWIGSNIDLK